MCNNQTINSNSLNILFWNPRSILQRTSDLSKLLENVDIFLCVESWLKDPDQEDEINANKKKNKMKKNHQTTLLPGFVQVAKYRKNKRGGGILIMVRDNIAFVEDKVNSPHPNFELCKIKLTNTIPVIDIMVVYKAPGDLSQQNFDSLISLIDHNCPTLLTGDFNSYNLIWNCKQTNKNGEFLAKSIDDNNLFLHNYDTYTHIDASNGNLSNLDLIFSSINFANNINYEVLDQTYSSDHYPIFISVN